MRNVLFTAVEEDVVLKAYNANGVVDIELDSEDCTLEVSLDRAQVEKLIAALQKSIQ